MSSTPTVKGPPNVIVFVVGCIVNGAVPPWSTFEILKVSSEPSAFILHWPLLSPVSKSIAASWAVLPAVIFNWLLLPKFKCKGFDTTISSALPSNVM